MSVVPFPAPPRFQPANSNEETYGLVCRDCQINAYLITTRDGELTIECIQCHAVVTEGVIAYVFGRPENAS